MRFILLCDMALLTTVLSYMIDLILTSIGVIYHIECAMTVLKYLPLDPNSEESITYPSMVLFSLRLYG